MKYLLTLFIASLFLTSINAQFAPGVGEDGTTAIIASDANIINWAKTCTVNRGLLNIADPDGALAGSGSADSATGESDGMTVSLGDGGTAILTFDPPIRDGNGFDFAVFENGFTSLEGDFLELGFVEVSSNGEDFVRFEGTSLTPNDVQIGSFGIIDPTQINNLAGKYYSGYGTPFDLSELEGNSDLNIQNITHVRIVDVIGTIEEEYASFDANDNKINDPYPTAFPTGGFDLESIAAFYEVGSVNVVQCVDNDLITVFPNPVLSGGNLFLLDEIEQGYTAILVDVNGKEKGVFENGRLQLLPLKRGVYFVEIRGNERRIVKKIIVI